MTGRESRLALFRRALVLLSGTALVVLLALVGLLARGAIVDAGHAVAAEAHVPSQGVALGVDHHHGLAALPSIHPAISTRAKSSAFAVPATTVVAAAWIFQRLRLARSGRLRALARCGLPPERAPPALRIA